jgi:hypothetical protein
MKKLLVLFCCLIFASNIVFADTVYPSNARYVIVNPNGRLKAATTFLLDTKTGKTWQYVQNSQGATSWEQLQYDYYNQDGTWGGMTLKAPVLTNP